MSELTRRAMLSGAAAAAIAPLAAPWPAFAAAPPAGTQAPGWYRYKVGSIEITVVTDGVNRFKLPTTWSPMPSGRRSTPPSMPPTWNRMCSSPYNPIVVNTGGKLVVIDTGTGEAAFQRARARPAS